MFIRDGQSLSDAMKESKKFDENDDSSNGLDEPQRRVYGKDEGQTYEIKNDSLYTLTGDRAGQTIEVPENESGNFTVYKAPRVDGFVDGKYVFDENKNAILPNGRIVLNDHAFNNKAVTQTKAMVEQEALRLSGVVKDGQFYRGSDNKKELEYIKNGTLKASKNHMTGKSEDGVSVWESPKYSFKYMYKVSGKVVGIGSDGEPVLDPKSIKLISNKSYGMSDYKKGIETGKKIFCEKYDWTEAQFDAAISGKIEIKTRL